MWKRSVYLILCPYQKIFLQESQVIYEDLVIFNFYYATSIEQIKDTLIQEMCKVPTKF